MEREPDLRTLMKGHRDAASLAIDHSLEVGVTDGRLTPEVARECKVAYYRALSGLPVRELDKQA